MNIIKIEKSGPSQSTSISSSLQAHIVPCNHGLFFKGLQPSSCAPGHPQINGCCTPEPGSIEVKPAVSVLGTRLNCCFLKGSSPAWIGMTRPETPGWHYDLLHYQILATVMKQKMPNLTSVSIFKHGDKNRLATSHQKLLEPFNTFWNHATETDALTDQNVDISKTNERKKILLKKQTIICSSSILYLEDHFVLSEVLVALKYTHKY